MRAKLLPTLLRSHGPNSCGIKVAWCCLHLRLSRCGPSCLRTTFAFVRCQVAKHLRLAFLKWKFLCQGLEHRRPETGLHCLCPEARYCMILSHILSLSQYISSFYLQKKLSNNQWLSSVKKPCPTIDNPMKLGLTSSKALLAAAAPLPAANEALKLCQAAAVSMRHFLTLYHACQYHGCVTRVAQVVRLPCAPPEPCLKVGHATILPRRLCMEQRSIRLTLIMVEGWHVSRQGASSSPGQHARQWHNITQVLRRLHVSWCCKPPGRRLGEQC